MLPDLFMLDGVDDFRDEPSDEELKRRFFVQAATAEIEHRVFIYRPARRAMAAANVVAFT